MVTAAEAGEEHAFGPSLSGPEKKYPIAEIFTSPQGEGLYSGTLMTFVRIAGCTVGKKISSAFKAIDPFFSKATCPELPVYTEQCTTWDGREFLCDTDFRTKQVLNVEGIVSNIPSGIKHVCITGGEPLAHDLFPLLRVLFERDIQAHIETSGTLPIWPYSHWVNQTDQRRKLWVTVSPKFGCLADNLRFIDEMKFLVDEKFDPENVHKLFATRFWKDSISLPIVWLQPINHESSIHQANLQRCLDLLPKNPTWRISTQNHKVWNVR